MARQGLNDRVEKEVIERPIDTLFQTNNDNNEDDNTDFVRATYYVTPVIVECIRILSYKERKQKSLLLRELLEKAIPDEIMEEAINNLK